MWSQIFLALKQLSGGLFCPFGSPITFRIPGSSKLLSGIPIGPGPEASAEHKLGRQRGSGKGRFQKQYSYLFIPYLILERLREANKINRAHQGKINTRGHPKQGQIIETSRSLEMFVQEMLPTVSYRSGQNCLHSSYWPKQVGKQNPGQEIDTWG